MSRHRINIHFRKVDEIGIAASRFVPIETRGAADFRAELAGLLTVTIASCYENCVKDVLVNYAARRHTDFEMFSRNEFSRLNSKISVSDLYRVSQKFSPSIKENFKSLLQARSEALVRRVGVDPREKYSQILSWRHDYAHAGIKNTSLEEALKFHSAAKRVLYCFDEAFNC